MLPSKNIIENVSNASNLTTLVKAVQAGGLTESLKADGPFTVFGPTNEAFAMLPSGTLETLLKPENKLNLTSVLTFHVVSGKFTVNDLKDGQRLKTLQGDELAVYKKDGKTMINGALIETPDVMQKNGVAHVINKVLVPPANQKTIAGINIPRTQTIAQSAVTVPSLSTLVTAATAGGLNDTLSNENTQITVFGPANDAFSKLPSGTLETLLKPENKAMLVSTITYHVIPGNYSVDQMYDGQKLMTVNGQSLLVRKTSDKVQIINENDPSNTAAILFSDIYQKNGVAHVIDSVLIPKQ